jgi:hypothetical protein
MRPGPLRLARRRQARRARGPLDPIREPVRAERLVLRLAQHPFALQMAVAFVWKQGNEESHDDD